MSVSQIHVALIPHPFVLHLFALMPPCQGTHVLNSYSLLFVVECPLFGFVLFCLPLVSYVSIIFYLQPLYQEHNQGIKQGLGVPRIAHLSIHIKLDSGELIMNCFYENVSILYFVAHCLWCATSDLPT
jgi:hypothetical protein